MIPVLRVKSCQYIGTKWCKKFEEVIAIPNEAD